MTNQTTKQRKVRAPSSAFRQYTPDDAKENMRTNIRRMRERGENIERTSFKQHGCNRCPECTGRCPT